MIILSFIYKKNNQSEKLLHSICKSCNIDSVKFEKQMKQFASFLSNKRQKVYAYLTKILSQLIRLKNIFIQYLKKSIRKKLFKEQKVEKVSEYISEMKK